MSEEVISFLERRRKSCYHHGGLTFDPDEAFAECNACGAKVSLAFALQKMIAAESRAQRIIARAKLEAKEIAEKKKVKCEHCRKFTQIKTNVKDWQIVQAAHLE